MAVSAPDARRIIAALRAVESHKFERFQPYPWQLECYTAGASKSIGMQRLIMAGNRVGKTLGLSFETACHATGRYPSWWPGLQFKFAPVIWCCGVSGEQMRDVLQRTLLGDMDEKGNLSGGLIHRRYIVHDSLVRDSGTPRLVKDVRIRHELGETTLISFKSYTQGPKPLMGSNVDFAQIDEQPPDEAYNQILTRTTLGNRGNGGRLLIGFTPEMGLTEVLRQWMDERKPGQWMTRVTWDDSPHLTEEIKNQIREATSEQERTLREKGQPIFGSGPVFETPVTDYSIDPFPIPGYFRVVAAIDFGLAHNFAACWVATNVETETHYVFDEYATSNRFPPMHATALNERGNNIPVVYPHDGHIREKSSGETLANIYRRHGAKLAVQFTNDDGSLYVRPGLLRLNTLLALGKLRVFSTCRQTLREMAMYHYDSAGNPIAAKDDSIDAMRYAVLSAGRIGVDYEKAFKVDRAYNPNDVPLVDY